MKKILALMILLLVIAVGCTKETKTQTKETTAQQTTQESTQATDLSNDLSGVNDSKDIDLGDLENLDLEIDEKTLE